MESLTSFLTWTAYGDEKTIQEGHQAKADKENSDLDDKKNEETSREKRGEPCKEEEKVQEEQEVTVQHNGDQNDEQNEQMGLEVL